MEEFSDHLWQMETLQAKGSATCGLHGSALEPVWLLAEVLVSRADKPEVSLLGKQREKEGPVTKQKALSPKLLSDNLLASFGVFSPAMIALSP